MNEDVVRIYHPELDLESEVHPEAAEVWLGHGWTRLEDKSDAAVSRVDYLESADETDEEN